MSTTEAGHPASNEASVGSVDMKLEAAVIPVSDVDPRRRSTRASGGDSTRISGTRTSESSSSILRAPSARYSSAPASLLLPRGRPRVSSSSPTSNRHTTTSSAMVPTRPRSFTTPAGATTASTPTFERAAPIRNGVPTHPSSSSAIRTATCGSCRRSRAAYPAASTRPRSAPPENSRKHSNEQRPRTANTRSAPASEMRTGPPGTPPTCWRSKPATSFRPDRLRRHRPRRRCARRTLRRRARRGRAARRRRRTRARRWRVLQLGVHPVEDAASPG